MLLGMVGPDVAVATMFGYDDDATSFVIDIVATSVDHRRHGYAFEAIERALTTIGATKDGYQADGEVLSRIHTENYPSQNLFAKAGFERLDVVDRDYATWIYAG